MTRPLLLTFAWLFLGSTTLFAQTTAFSYQGKLADNGNPTPTGNYDFQFTLFDALSGGAQQGTTQTATNVLVTNGIFSVTLDFVSCSGCSCPTCFNGLPRFLEISVKPDSGSTFQILAPRQPVGATPYAIRSDSAKKADGLSVACTSCITSSQIQSIQGSQVSGNIAGSQINGAIPVESVPAGSASYVQNTTSQQLSTNFNISGDGTAGGTINGSILNATMQFNLNGLRVLSTGTQRLSVGVASNAGAINTSSFGFFAGHNNTGENNSFFGSIAGGLNTDGENNSFFGTVAGENNKTERNNTFIGSTAGDSNGFGDTNNTANNNTFVGYAAGFHNTTGFNNTFAGGTAGLANVFGNNNSVVGYQANLGANNLVNATAIGASAMVAQSNSLVLGSINGTNGATADTNVGIGTTSPATKLHVSGVGAIRARINASGNAGLALTLNDQPGWSLATVTGGQFQIFNDAITQNAVWIDPANNNFGINTSTPSDRLDVNGIIRVASLGTAGSTALCRNASNQISTCSSSLRYKTNIVPLSSGLDLVRQLSPITFNWKASGEADLGRAAEQVAKVEPLLVTHNGKGEVEGVKYDRVSVVLLNAVKEQQLQIETQRKEIEEQRKQIEALRILVCKAKTKATLCK